MSCNYTHTHTHTYIQTHRHTDTHTDRVTTEGTLSGFQDFFLQPIIKDRPNTMFYLIKNRKWNIVGVRKYMSFNCNQSTSVSDDILVVLRILTLARGLDIIYSMHGIF